MARICLRLDGLPLALELAAGRLAALGPATIADRLDDRFRVLRTDSHVSPTRQHTLTATLDWSHELLEPDERALFRRLGAFAGGFDLKAVERVCSGGELDGPTIADVLARLVEKSLVATDAGSSRERRYRLLETVRLYARERLGEAGETDELADRQAQWALALAEIERGVGAARPVRRQSSFGAWHAARTSADRCDAFVRRAHPLLAAQDRSRRGRGTLRQVLSAAPERTPLRAQALLAAAAIDFRSGALASSRAHMEESRAVASEIGDARAEWRAFGVPWGVRPGERRGRHRAAVARTCARGRAARGLRRRAGDLRSLARDRPLDPGRPGAGRSSHGAQHRSVRHAWRPAGADPVTRQHRRDPNRTRPRVAAGFGSSFRTRSSRSSRSSSDAAVGYALANCASIARVRGDLASARESCSTRVQRGSLKSGDETGTAAVLVRRAYLEFTEGALPVARTLLSRRARGPARATATAEA